MRLSFFFIALFNAFIFPACRGSYTATEPQKGNEPTKLQANIEATEILRKEFEEYYGYSGRYETTWYSSIVNLSVQGDTAIAKTNLTKADNKAKGICEAVSAHIYSMEWRWFGINNIKVVSSDSDVLIHRHGLEDDCDN